MQIFFSLLLLIKQFYSYTARIFPTCLCCIGDLNSSQHHDPRHFEGCSTKLLHRGTITDFKTIFFSKEFPKIETELYFCRKISAFRKKPARYLLKASNRLPSFSREPLARRLRAKLNDCDAIVVRHKITRQSHHQRHRTRAHFDPK